MKDSLYANAQFHSAQESHVATYRVPFRPMLWTKLVRNQLGCRCRAPLCAAWNADDRCGWHFAQMKTTAKLQCSHTLFVFDVKAVCNPGDFTIACIDKTSCYLGPFLERSHSGRAMTQKSPRRWQMLRGSRATSHNLKWQRPAYSSRRTVHIVTRQLGRLFAPVPLTATAYTLISNRFSDLWPPALYGRKMRVVLYHHSRKGQRYAPTASQGRTEHLLQQLNEQVVYWKRQIGNIILNRLRIQHWHEDHSNWM